MQQKVPDRSLYTPVSYYPTDEYVCRVLPARGSRLSCDSMAGAAENRLRAPQVSLENHHVVGIESRRAEQAYAGGREGADDSVHGPLAAAQKALWEALMRGDTTEALRQADTARAIRGDQPPSPLALKLIERLNRLAAENAVRTGSTSE